MVLGFFKWRFFFFAGNWEFLLSMAWKQRRSTNGDVMVLIALKPLCRFLLFHVCVVARCKMIGWQGDCQLRCAREKSRGAATERCAIVKISNVVLVF